MECFSKREFKDEKLYTEALTHKSYSHENPMSGNHNERLEFLGDSVITCVVTDYLLNRFKEHNEGQLSALRAKLVCRQTLYRFALKLGLNDDLKLGAGATLSNARNSEKVLEDTFEAYIGAVFLDSDKDYSGIYKFMEPFITQQVDELVKVSFDSAFTFSYSTTNGDMIGPKDLSLDLPVETDSVNKLQTWSQRRYLGLPLYTEIEKTGSDHNPTFIFQVTINGINGKLCGTGTARNKKNARRQAANNLLNIILELNNLTTHKK